MTKPSLRLAQSLLIFVVLLLPAMVLLGAAEGRAGAPTVIFWLLVLLPLLVLPWLWSCCAPEDTEQGPQTAAKGMARESARPDDLAELVTPVVEVRRSYAMGDVPVVEGDLRVPSRQAFTELEVRLASRQSRPLMEGLAGRGVRIFGLPATIDERLRQGSSHTTQWLLFAATVATTIYAGAAHRGVSLLENPGSFLVGVPYALALLGILGVHELGHYVVARRNGVHVTPPFFIPVPMGLGTFGAFIQIKSLIRSRRAVFDIGIAGPLAGLLIAVPALYFGLRNALPVDPAGAGGGVQIGVSLMLALVYQLAHGGELGEAAVRLTPVAYAGWIGLFVTALNLLPVGQLDGGHIVYGLFGRRPARAISIVSVVAMAALGLFVWPGLLMWALLLTLIAGFSHMPAADDVTAPDRSRFALGALALVILILIIVPVPGALSTPGLDSPYQ